MKCTGIVNEAKCILKQSELNLGEILVCKEDVKYFQIKNTSKISAIFKVVVENLPEYCDVSPKSGKIPPDQSIDMQVKFCCNQQQSIQDDIEIMVRGGKVLRLPFIVQTVVPKVEILEKEFNFGKITTLGNCGLLEMTMVNNSSIDAEMILDMRTEEENPDCPDGIECLSIMPHNDDLEESIMKSVQIDYLEDNDVKKKEPEVDLENVDATDSEDEKEDQHNSKLFNIVLRAGQKLGFTLKFAPKDVKPYQFELPVTLQRYGKLAGLTRMVLCRGMKPKFLVDPQIVEFPRKIIINVDKMFPSTMDVILSNPEKRPINWKLDEKMLENDKIFAVHPREGRVDPGQTLRIKASFTPQQANIYEKSIPLYIDDPELPANTPCLELKLRGEAAYPKLLFDRREILLPVTPLGLEARCQFRIINDGYENLNLQYRVMEELGNLNIHCTFPEGQTLGVGKARIRVEACFSSAKPMSFTSKLEFKDEQGKSYVIPISGTSDNSVFTTYQYLQRNKGDFTISAESEKSPVMIKEEEQDAEQSDGGSNTNLKKKNNQSLVSGRTFNSKVSQNAHLGYNPIPKHMMEYSKEHIKTWLNNNVVLSDNIMSFPETIVEHQGDQLFELLSNLQGGKNLAAMKATIDKNLKRSDRAKQLFDQYDQLIRFLKQEGALLNHIRPQYLLSYTDYQAYVKYYTQQESLYVHPTHSKINFQKFQYISTDVWTSLFYQIIKLYYLQRVSAKALKQIPNLPHEKSAVSRARPPP